MNPSESRTSQVDLEKCVENIGNRFDLVIAATELAYKIRRNNRHSTKREHQYPVITSLLKIQNSK